MLAFGFALSRELYGAASRADLNNHFRKRSVVAAAMAKELALLVGAPQEEVFLGALIQDVGVLALREALKEPYDRLLSACQGDHDRLVPEEYRVLGTSHAEVGAWLLKQWGLPKVLQSLVACSHTVNGDQAGLPERCVAMSGPLSELWLNPDSVQKMPRQRREAAELLGIELSRIDQAMQETARKIPDLVRLFDLDTGSEDYESILVKAQQTALAVGLQGIAHVRQREKVLRDLAGKVDQLKSASRTDPLTGLFNRAFLEEALDIAFQESATDDLACGLCFCDVDNFKSINDQFGHATGDAVLKTVAASLKESLRQGDLVGRYGGDEFLIVLRGCSAEGFHEVCRRIRKHVSLRLQTFHGELGVSCSISIGYAVQSDQGPFNSSRSWLESADQALYEAKRKGKNQVVGCIVPSERRLGGAGAFAE